MNFWHYNPEDIGWYIYRQGTVTPDGARVLPDPGVVLYEFTGASAQQNTPGLTGPAKKPTQPSTPGADPVDLSTGLFVYNKTDVVLPDVLPLTLTRTYRPEDSASR